jgi:hypothetical protein
MNGERGFTDKVHQYLDGEAVGLDGESQSEADQFVQAMANYVVSLEGPGDDVERAVMATLAARRSPARREALWRWFLQPQPVRVRPALAAALVAVVVGVTWFVADRRSEHAEVVAGHVQLESRPVLVRFELVAPNAQQVAVAGSFNEWDEQRVPLTRNSANGLWSVTLPLRPGEHQYLFVIDGDRWVPDPSAHAQVDDGFGQLNSVIVVGPRGVVRS